MAADLYQRFLASTRGRLIALLRRNSRTVDELAQRLGLTDNAVRAHLATLERDGLVEQRGVRRGGGSGKPAFAYGLTPEAERLFPRPYAVVLDEILTGLHERMPQREIEALLGESGRRLAEQQPAAPVGDLRTRLEAAVAALNRLGALAELEERDGELRIHCYNCMLAGLAAEHPEVCHLGEAFVSEVAGTPVQEQCERGATPRCHFAPSRTGG